jgi:streptogramin lyase
LTVFQPGAKLESTLLVRGEPAMKPFRILASCALAVICCLSAGTRAQVATEFSAGITPFSSPQGIAAGPDGNLWFTEYNGNRIGRITPAGVITEYSAGMSAGASPWSIAAGPDGNMWFTEFNGNAIGRITVPVPAPALLGAGSRKMHGSAGALNLPL